MSKKTTKKTTKVSKEVEKEVKPKKAEFTVTLGYNGKEEVLKGDDFVALFTNWEPGIFKTVITLKAEHGKKVLQRRLPVMQAKRISGNYRFASIYANQLLKFLG